MTRFAALGIPGNRPVGTATQEAVVLPERAKALELICLCQLARRVRACGRSLCDSGTGVKGMIIDTELLAAERLRLRIVARVMPDSLKTCARSSRLGRW